MAIVTRNSRRAAEATLARHNLSFPAVVTREDEPHKPHPFPVRHAAGLLGLDAADCVMVGDGEHDVRSGAAAGAATLWLSLGRARNFEPAPTYEVVDLPAAGDTLGRLLAPRP